jgi:uncharacterized protein
MQFKITKKFEVKKPVTPVWGFLSDPRRVATCVPGAQITEALDDRRYIGTVKVKVGPLVSSYRGELVIERLDPQNFEMELVGKGLDVKGKGSASMKLAGKLRALPQGGTEVEGSSEISVTGVMAQFGSRVVEEISHQMFEQFTQSLKNNLENCESSEEVKASRALKAVPILATASKATVANFLRRIIGRTRGQ